MEKIERIPVSRAEVYWYLKDKGYSTCERIALDIGLDKGTVSKHALALVRVGILIVLPLSGSTKVYGVHTKPNADEQLLEQLRELESHARSVWRLRGIEPDFKNMRR
jgi:DNA-binding transcriptional ArsR family regulator